MTCNFTGHQVNADQAQFSNYVQTNTKYLCALNNQHFDFSGFCKYIVPHKGNPEQKMFCQITRREVNRNRADLILHKNGKHYCKTMFETWRTHMLKAQKMLKFKLKLAIKKKKTLKIKARHRAQVVSVE